MQNTTLPKLSTESSVTRRLRNAIVWLCVIAITAQAIAMATSWYGFREHAARNDETISTAASLNQSEQRFRELSAFGANKGRLQNSTEADQLSIEFASQISRFRHDLSILGQQPFVDPEILKFFADSLDELQVRRQRYFRQYTELARLRDRFLNRQTAIVDIARQARSFVSSLETDITLDLVENLPARTGSIPGNLADLRRISVLEKNFEWIEDTAQIAVEIGDQHSLDQRAAEFALKITTSAAQSVALPDHDARTKIAIHLTAIRKLGLDEDGLFELRRQMNELEIAIAHNDRRIADLNDAISHTLNTAYRSMTELAERGMTQTYLIVIAVELGLIALTFIAIVVAALALWRVIVGDIAGRLEGLWHQTAALAQGHLDNAVSIGGNDEIAALGREIEKSRLTSQRLQIAEAQMRDSEERLALAAQAGQIGIVDWIRHPGHEPYYSAELAQMLGLGDRETVLSPDQFVDRVSPGKRARVRSILENTPPSNDSQTIICELDTDDGQRNWHELAIRVLTTKLNDHVEVDRVIATVRNIDELITIQQKLQAQTEDLKRKNEELDRFAYVASHDLKSPLRAIQDLAGWLSEDLDAVMDDDSKHSMRLLKNRAARLIRLLDDLLEFSRIAQPSNKPTTVDVNEIVCDAFSLACGSLPFELDIVKRLPVILTDATPLHQTFYNLFNNAIKHHDRETGKISIDYKLNNGLNSFYVEDDGPGIDPEYHERIFGMFTTLRSRDNVEGSGMGLAVIRKQVRLFGGEVSVKSEPAIKRGTRFRFTWLDHQSAATSDTLVEEAAAAGN